MGTESDQGPYWKTKLPWNVLKHQQVDDRAAVIAAMNATKRKLGKVSRLVDMYKSQIRELDVFAREVTKSDILALVTKGGATYFMPHQVAVNPNSESTPDRIVMNNTPVNDD